MTFNAQTWRDYTVCSAVHRILSQTQMVFPALASGSTLYSLRRVCHILGGCTYDYYLNY